MNIRTIALDDYANLTIFWKQNYFLSHADTAEHFSLFLKKNPDLSILIEEKGEIIGTALGSYDGRRGYLQKVVIKKELRNKRLGQKLVKEVVARLRRAGAAYIPISVEAELIPFYEKCGFLKKRFTINGYGFVTMSC